MEAGQTPPPPPPQGTPPSPTPQVTAPTKVCRHCGAQVQTLEKKCPHCGKKFKQRRTFLKIPLGVFLGGTLLIVGCVALLAGGTEEAEKHAITIGEFRSVQLGASQGAVQKKLGKPGDKQESEDETALPGIEPQGSSCIYYREKGKELLEGRTFQFCFENRKLTGRSAY